MRFAVPAVLLSFLLLDVCSSAISAISAGGKGPVAMLVATVAGAICVALVLAHRPLLPRALAVVGVSSVVTTSLALLTPGGGIAGLGELAALLVMIGTVSRLAPPPPAAAMLVLLAGAVITFPLRAEPAIWWPDWPLVMLVAVAVAVSFGLLLRWRDGLRGLIVLPADTIV